MTQRLESGTKCIPGTTVTGIDWSALSGLSAIPFVMKSGTSNWEIGRQNSFEDIIVEVRYDERRQSRCSETDGDRILEISSGGTSKN